jgi:hypothetical protein
MTTKFALFTDAELELLRPAIDALFDDVAANREPALSLVHGFAGEVGKRGDHRLLVERGTRPDTGDRYPWQPENATCDICKPLPGDPCVCGWEHL